MSAYYLLGYSSTNTGTGRQVQTHQREVEDRDFGLQDRSAQRLLRAVGFRSSEKRRSRATAAGADCRCGVLNGFAGRGVHLVVSVGRQPLLRVRVAVDSRRGHSRAGAADPGSAERFDRPAWRHHATSRADRSVASATRCRFRRPGRRAGRQAVAVSVRRDAARRTFQSQGRRARERRRHDGDVRVSDHDSGS